MTDDVRKLLGGYATGTLTELEKKALFDAALHDDALFAALADEHALKEILDDSAVRARLLQATEEPRFTVIGSLREWFESPKSKALVATGALLLGVIGFQQVRQVQNEPKSTMTAELRRPPQEQPVATQPLPPANLKAPVQNQANLDISPSVSTRRQASPAAKRDAVAQANVEREADEQIAATPSAPPPPPAAAAAVTESVSIVGGRTGVVAGGGPAAALSGFRAPSPAPASADSSASPRVFERAAGTSVTPLRYELLRRDAAGSFQAVPPDYEFTPGDIVRLRISSTRHGAVGISTNAANTTSAHTITANTWTEVPQNGGIAITADTARLVVAFTPTEAPTSRLLDTTEARAKVAGPPPVSLEIPIRQKKP